MAALLALALAGCVERAPTAQSRRNSFNRSSVGSVVLAQLPQPAKPVGAVFGDALELVGVDWSPATASAGQRVEVTFYYKVLDNLDEDYKVFVHAEDHSDRNQRVNADHWPADGVYPTGAWRRGEVIRDKWSFTVPSHFRGEAVDVWTGLYQPGKEDRFPVTNREQVRNDGQNRVMAASIPVAG